jgi:hypothetical protein
LLALKSTPPRRLNPAEVGMTGRLRLLSGGGPRELVCVYPREPRLERGVLGLIDRGEGPFDRERRFVFGLVGRSLDCGGIPLCLLGGKSLVSRGDVLIPGLLSALPRGQDLLLLGVCLLAQLVRLSLSGSVTPSR